jgi:HPr kinase/phosphorylase
VTVDAALLTLGLQTLHDGGQAAGAGTADLSARDIGFFHPASHRPLQVIGTAAEAARASGHAPWTGTPPRYVIVGSDVPPKPWSQLARNVGARCLVSHLPAHVTLDRIRSALADKAVPQQTLHATLVEILGLGVLLIGPSGSGKSELALDFVARGHRLVADDAVELRSPAPQCLLGTCPPLLSGFIEVRGLGVLDLRAAYGEQAIATRARIDLAIRIEAGEAIGEPLERLHGRRRSLTLLGVTIPEIILPARLGHNAAMVETACRDHWLRRAGYVACTAFADAQTRLAAGGAAP